MAEKGRGGRGGSVENRFPAVTGNKQRPADEKGGNTCYGEEKEAPSTQDWKKE